MDIKNYFFIPCSEAVTTCDKVQYQDATGNEKLKFRFHLLLCKACNKYHKDNQKLTSLIKKSNIKTCTPSQKKSYQKQIDAYLRRAL